VLEGLSIFAFAILGFAIGAVSRSGLEPWKIRAAARRLNLRDRGRIPDFLHSDGGEAQRMYMAHTSCHTPARIGITRDTHVAVKYCWRCEYILGDDAPGGPKGRDDLPGVKSQERGSGNADSDNVVPLPLRAAG
jgi:hypothetical protein